MSRQTPYPSPDVSPETAPEGDLSSPPGVTAIAGARRFVTGGLSLRQFTAHGVLVNAVFDVGVGLVGLARGVVLAALLDRADFGLWGILLVSLGVLAQLKVIGISDKYVQQSEADQQLAFQRAFTLEMATSLIMTAILFAAVPLVCVIYGNWTLLAPGLVLSTMLIAYAFQSAQWIHYRNMNFLTQRLQTAVEPVVGLVVSVVLALVGAGYWALVLGALAGAWSGAIVAVAGSPYPLRWRLDRSAIGVYWGFSAPILLATGSAIVLANGVVLTTKLSLGLAAVGAVTLADSVTTFTTKLDDTVAATIYPGICAINDQVALLRESFVKTNRLAMLWAIPFGVGLAIFAPELIRYVLGLRWRSATSMLEITGIVAALNHIGFNWDDYYRARSQTRPIAVATVAGVAATLGAGIPLLLLDGLQGLAIGVGVGASTVLVARAFYIRQLFGINLVRHGLRAVVPVLPAVAVILGLRALISGPERLGLVCAEVALYVLLAFGLSALAERRLLAEALAYLRRPR